MAKQNDIAYQQGNLNNHAGDSVVNDHVRPLRQWLGFEPLYQGRKMQLQSEKTCLDFFYEAAQLNPQAPALTMGEQTLSYADIVSAVDTLAAWMLADSHIKAADRVALYLPNSLSYVIGILATWRADLVVANINFLSENNNVLKQLQDSGAKILITIPAFLPQVEDMLLQTSIRHIITTQADDYINFVGKLKSWLSPKKWIEKWQADSTVIRYVRLRSILNTKRNPKITWPTVDANDLALIQYTSGTTDLPKAVSLSHLNLSANYQQVTHMLGNELEAGKVGLCPIPMQSIVGLSFTLSLLSIGGHAILSSMPELLQKPKAFQNSHIDILAGIPFLYDQLIKKDHLEDWLRNVKLYLSGGGFTSRAMQQKWFKLTGKYLCEAYGMSEASPLVSINPPQRIRMGSVGVVLPNTEVCVVDKNQKVLGFNQPGELWVRGPQVMRGYWHQPAATQKAMTYDDWFKTGDIVSLSEDGFISMLERKKDAFWIQNQQIFPQQVEQQIIQHEDVIDCAMIQDQDLPMTPVRLFVVAKQGLTKEKLTAFLKDQQKINILPDYIEFVDYLPKGPMGKVLRRLLRNRDLPDDLSTKTPTEDLDTLEDVVEPVDRDANKVG